MIALHITKGFDKIKFVYGGKILRSISQVINRKSISCYYGYDIPKYDADEFVF